MRASLLPAALGLAAAACLAVRVPEAGEPLELAAGEGLVFGRVRVFEGAGELTPWELEGAELLLPDPEIRLSLFAVESGRKRPDVPLRRDGGFEWIVPQGTYLLYHTPSVEPPLNEPLAAFQVRAGTDPVDLGELRLSVAVARPLPWDEPVTYEVVGAEGSPGTAEAQRAFLARHAGVRSVGAGIFVVDEDLGGLFDDWSRAACARVLARHGIDLLEE